MTVRFEDQLTDPRVQAAIGELQDLIRSHFTSAIFEVGEASDPDGVYMRAIVDVDDTDDVTEVFIDRMIDIQVSEGLPIYVVPVRTPERIAAAMERERKSRYRFELPG